MAELIMQEETSTPATPSSGKWKVYGKSLGLFVLDDAGLEIGPIGPLYEYIITPSVSSNNLTLAIKNIAGADASSSRPIVFRAGDNMYYLTGSASFTKNAGTNWCNAGATELATNPIDFFVYAIGETGASAGLKFGFSRIPWAITMGDFVNTTTSEKYIAGNWTNFNSTDAVQVIGRFRATLSATASFNWSIATSVVINRPIYKTDWLTFNVSGLVTIGNGTQLGRYKIQDRVLTGHVHVAYGNTTAFSSSDFTVPFSMSANHALSISNAALGTFNYLESGVAAILGNARYQTATTIRLQYVGSAGAYANIALISSTIPFTWGTNDDLGGFFGYEMA